MFSPSPQAAPLHLAWHTLRPSEAGSLEGSLTWVGERLLQSPWGSVCAGMAIVGVGWSPRFEEHAVGLDHPERPARSKALGELLSRWGNELTRYPFQPATREQLESIHHRRYVQEVANTHRTPVPVAFDSDTAATANTYEVACLAAGAAVGAVDAVMQERCLRAFALGRPPGHHAEVDQAMGYCYFNNVAIAAQHALDSYGLCRIAIVDWDVHFGNGTHRSFEGRADVLFASTHQYKLFPGSGHYARTGRGRGAGFSLNLPLTHNATDADLLWLYRSIVIPVLSEYRPQLLLVSAGFDAHESDHTANQRISSRGFGQLCAMLCTAAEELCEGRVALVLEGGYSLTGLVEAVDCTLHAARQPENWLPPSWQTPSSHLELTLESLRRLHEPCWPSLRSPGRTIAT